MLFISKQDVGMSNRIVVAGNRRYVALLVALVSLALLLIQSRSSDNGNQSRLVVAAATAYDVASDDEEVVSGSPALSQDDAATNDMHAATALRGTRCSSLVLRVFSPLTASVVRQAPSRASPVVS